MGTGLLIFLGTQIQMPTKWVALILPQWLGPAPHPESAHSSALEQASMQRKPITFHPGPEPPATPRQVLGGAGDMGLATWDRIQGLVLVSCLGRGWGGICFLLAMLPSVLPLKEVKIGLVS